MGAVISKWAAMANNVAVAIATALNKANTATPSGTGQCFSAQPYVPPQSGGRGQRAHVASAWVATHVVGFGASPTGPWVLLSCPLWAKSNGKVPSGLAKIAVGVVHQYPKAPAAPRYWCLKVKLAPNTASLLGTHFVGLFAKAPIANGGTKG